MTRRTELRVHRDGWMRFWFWTLDGFRVHDSVVLAGDDGMRRTQATPPMEEEQQRQERSAGQHGQQEIWGRSSHDVIRMLPSDPATNRIGQAVEAVPHDGADAHDAGGECRGGPLRGRFHCLSISDAGLAIGIDS